MAEESHATHAFEALVTHVVDADKWALNYILIVIFIVTQ